MEEKGTIPLDLYAKVTAEETKTGGIVDAKASMLLLVDGYMGRKTLSATQRQELATLRARIIIGLTHF